MKKEDIALTGDCTSSNISSPETAHDILERIDDLMREQARLGEQIDAAKEQALQSHFPADRRNHERRGGRDRRRKDNQ